MSIKDLIDAFDTQPKEPGTADAVIEACVKGYVSYDTRQLAKAALMAMDEAGVEPDAAEAGNGRTGAPPRFVWRRPHGEISHTIGRADGRLCCSVALAATFDSHEAAAEAIAKLLKLIGK